MCLLMPLPGQGGARGQLLVQRNLDSALRPYAPVQSLLLFIALLGLLMAVLGSAIIGRVGSRSAAPRCRRPYRACAASWLTRL